MKTGDHILRLRLSIPNTHVFDADCSCGKVLGRRLQTRKEAREIHEQHFQRYAVSVEESPRQNEEIGR